MIAVMFPGQGCQKKGMGKDLYDNFAQAREYYELANDFMGKRFTDIMFFGDELDLFATLNTQPAVFLYSTILALVQKDIKPDLVAGHSLGEFSALVVCGVLSFEAGLNLVIKRAEIAQKVCENNDTAMGAVIGLEDEYIERRLQEISEETGEPIFFANYNGPGQVVITGSKNGIKIACKAFKNEGAKKAVPLSISGSFHSPFMSEARIELGRVISGTTFNEPNCAIVQCVDGHMHTDIDEIRANLIDHITHPVLWTKMVHSLVNEGANEFYEAGPDDTLQKIVRRMYPDLLVTTLSDIPTYQNILTQN